MADGTRTGSGRVEPGTPDEIIESLDQDRGDGQLTQKMQTVAQPCITGTTAATTGVALTTASTTLAAANEKRVYCFVQNQGTDNVFIDIAGGTAVADKTCIRLPPGAGWTERIAATLITGIAASGTQDVHITEVSLP